MSDWKSGMPVSTAADVAAWKLWRSERRRELQRMRRRHYQRIDYYPDSEAFRAIKMIWQPRRAGHDLTSAINVILADWLKLRGL